MTEHQIEKLDKLIGVTINYQGKDYLVKNYKNNHGTVVIFTKQRTFNFLTSELDTFLDNIYMPTTEKNTNLGIQVNNQKKNQELPVVEKAYKTSLAIYEPTESQKEVNKTLLEMLKKVKEDPKAIPQAKAVCEIANTMVNLEKAQIQLMQLAQRRN